MDFDRRLVTRDGAPVKLTPKEYDLLAVLFRNAGRVVTHRQILSSVWGPAHTEDTQYLRVFIGQLRAKIERDPTIAENRHDRARRRLSRCRGIRRRASPVACQ